MTLAHNIPVILIILTLPLIGLHSNVAISGSPDQTTTTVTVTQTLTSGQLRVWQPENAIQTTIYLDGVARGDWGFWSDMPQGNYSLTFSDVPGWKQPTDLSVLIYADGSLIPEQNYTVAAPWIIPVYSGDLTEVRVEFTELAYLTHYQVISQIHRAEQAGATDNEVAGLLVLLNAAVDSNDQAAKMTKPEDAQRRAELLRSVDQDLATVQGQAGQLEVTASHRSLLNKILSYISGGVAALLVTLAYGYGLSFWRKYRVRLAFDMKVTPK